MQEHTHDRISGGIAVLASDDPDWDDGPFPVRGVALPEDITTNGDNKENVSTYWPPETVKEAAAFFEGRKIVDGSEHTAEKALENPQPSPETILGEITDVRYEPGLGVLYEGEVDDPEFAKLIDRDRVEVSPTLYRALTDIDEESGTATADSVKAVRDLAIVSEGAAEGNSIEPAAAAMAALSAEALSAAFDSTGGDTSTEALQARIHTPEFDDTREVPWNAPTLDQFADEPWDNLSSSDQTDVADHFIASFSGFPPRNFSDLALPVVDAEGNLVLNALQNAKARVSQVEGLNPDERDRVRSVINRLANENFEGASFETMGAESPVDSGTGGDAGPSDDPAGASSSGRDTNPPGSPGGEDTMPNDPDNTITDEERRLLEALGDYDMDADAARETLRDYAALEEPTITEQSDVEGLREQVDTAKDIYAEALSERWDTSVEKIKENFGLEALREEFEDDDGNVDAEALVQMPETGDTDGPDDPDGGVDALADLDDDARAEVEACKDRLEYWEGKNDTIVDAEKEQLVETLGVDSFDDVDLEAI